MIISIIVSLFVLWVILFFFDNSFNLRKVIGIKIIENPLLRTFAFVLTTVLTGIFCSALVSEMTLADGTIDYYNIYKYPAFKYLTIIVEVFFIYNWLTFTHDADSSKYGDENFVNAYIVKNSLSEAVNQIRQGLKDGTLKVEDWKKALIKK